MLQAVMLTDEENGGTLTYWVFYLYKYTRCNPRLSLAAQISYGNRVDAVMSLHRKMPW